jgi:hypothetical protein
MRTLGNLLFRIIGRIGKKSGIDTSLNSINALNDNSVDVGMDEIVIKNFAPDSMHEFTAAVCHDVYFLRSPFTMKCGDEVLK